MAGVDGLADVQARLLQMTCEQRVDVWNRVDGTPQAKGADWWPWLVVQLDRRIREVLAHVKSDVAPPVRPGPKPGRRQRPSCAGTGQAPDVVAFEPRTYWLKNGRLHTLAGRGTCPVCGRQSAFTGDGGISRHGYVRGAQE